MKEELLKVNKEEGSAPTEWRAAMERSFHKMDKEVIAWNEGMVAVHTRLQSRTPLAGYSKDRGGGVGVAAFEPSSVCSAKMVQHFIEESNDKQLGTKCGHNHCNCVNGNNNDSFADKLGMFDGFIESVTSGLSSDALDALKVKNAASATISPSVNPNGVKPPLSLPVLSLNTLKFIIIGWIFVLNVVQADDGVERRLANLVPLHGGVDDGRQGLDDGRSRPRVAARRRSERVAWPIEPLVVRWRT
ncbi:hypothetical protein NL676_033367 [Syzygium grande]|nr:hypothetical protein NL676_033367 [Syzygium grande]